MVADLQERSVAHIDVAPVLGFMSAFSVLFSIILAIVGISLLFSAKSRRTFVVYSALALIPLIVGGLDGWINYRAAARVWVYSDYSPSEEEIAFAQPYIWVPVWTGVGCAAVILAIGLVGVIIKSRKPVRRVRVDAP